MTSELTDPQRRGLQLMMEETEGPFSVGCIPIYRLARNGRAPACNRVADSLVKKGLATKQFGSNYLYITDAGRTALAITISRSGSEGDRDASD